MNGQRIFLIVHVELNLSDIDYFIVLTTVSVNIVQKPNLSHNVALIIIQLTGVQGIKALIVSRLCTRWG